MLQLYIGNKNYSSWSMRSWVLLRQSGIAFEEVMVRFDSFSGDSRFKQRLGAISPAGRVPALVDDGFVVWDTLAIAEYVAEKFPEKNLWPQDLQARARARSVCAEMHSGFGALRSACGMNIEANLAEAGQIIWRDKPAVRADVARLVDMWSELLEQNGQSRTAGPPAAADGSERIQAKSTAGADLLFGDFSIADAYFAPVCMRLRTFALPVPPAIAAYVQRVSALPGVKAWIEGALAEHDFLDFEEPYRVQRQDLEPPT